MSGLAVEPDSFSMLEIYVGFRAGDLRWCIIVRTVLLYIIVVFTLNRSFSPTTSPQCPSLILHPRDR